MNNAVAQLAVNWLTIVPFTVHPLPQPATATELRNPGSNRVLFLMCYSEL